MKRNDEEPTLDLIKRAIESNAIGRNGDITRFVQCLRLIDGPYSIFVDAPWGSGKTFFVKQVAEALKAANKFIKNEQKLPDATLKKLFDDDDLEELGSAKSFLPIYFNAWENDHYDDPVIPLLASIAIEPDATKTRNGSSVAKSAIASILDTVLASSGLPLSTEKIVHAISGEDFLEDFKKRVELRSRINELIAELMHETANKVVLFIDELDRCRPEFATKLLEQTKGLFQQDDVIVVYSTDKIQLANSLEGLYGQKYDCLKYLERFYDFEFTLSYVDPKDYLYAKKINTHSSYCFMQIALEYISMFPCPLRTCNRLANQMQQGMKYIDSKHGNGSQGDWPIAFSRNALLPTFIAMSQFAPEMWEEVRSAKDFGHVFEFAKDNQKFVNYLDRSIAGSSYINSDEKISDAKRKSYMEDVCAMIFLSDFNDQRLKNADERISVWGEFDTDILRSFAFPPIGQE